MKREKLFLKTRRSGKFLSRHRRKDQSTKGAKRLRKCYKSIKEVWTLMESLNVEEGQEIFQKRWMKSFPLKVFKAKFISTSNSFSANTSVIHWWTPCSSRANRIVMKLIIQTRNNESSCKTPNVKFIDSEFSCTSGGWWAGCWYARQRIHQSF